MRWSVALLSLFACSEYDLTQEKDPVEPVDTEEPGRSILEVDPASIEADGVCISVDREVTLSSTGDEVVQVQDLDIEGDGWSIEAPSTPFDLAPGDTQVITVIGSVGEATLTVVSDGEDAVIEVPLAAIADNAPEIALVSPDDSDILDNTDVELQVNVSDVEDDASELYVSWSSDVDGRLDGDFAESDGSSSVTWTGTKTGGDHTLTATVVDTCGNEATLDVQICQQAGYDVENLDLSTWTFDGDARYDSADGWVELTGPSTYQLGSAFQTTATTGDNVTIEFQFYTGGGTGADGFAVTALDTDRATSYLGSSGGCLGYGYNAGCGNLADPLPGWSIEVDTYYNSDVDPTADDHVSFHFDGDVASPEIWSALPEMENNGWHTMVIEVADPHVTVTIDGTTYLDDDVSGYLAFPAEVGFTAATGGETNYHLIDALTVTEYVCEED